MSLHYTAWDWALVAAVTAQCTLIAYLRSQKLKAVILSLPVPFTVASLAVGKPIGFSHISGFGLFLCYIYAVTLLHAGLRIPVVVCIAASALAYAGVAWGLAQAVEATGTAFWVSCLATALVAGLLFRLTPRRTEPGHRSPLPLWMKLPIIAAVILGIVTTKQALQGFMTTFPMVSVVTAYEARHGLWTVARQMNLFVFSFAPSLALSYVLQNGLGLSLGAALAAAWVVFLAVLWPLTRMAWRAKRAGVSQE
ncbi:MAG TPA: hypothetical protein P5137_16080 [Candidatus Brocadiia bacterium]|nr:hypothetical protein [Candidatus Brocadiia bacterium]